ncbi:MAG: hypothetical protein QOE90_182 [Thermoplasmata archaeon]|jgi:hypothetical protein|nr:hypothetical protein [Thermoplasmata archaeon]
MAFDGLEAYPILLGAFCGILFLGRSRDGLFEDIRLAVAGLLLGTATAAFVGMVIATGLTAALVLGVASLVGAYALATVHLHARLTRHLHAPRFDWPPVLLRRV